MNNGPVTSAQHQRPSNIAEGNGMSTTESAVRESKTALAHVFAPIAGELEIVSDRLRQELRHPDPLIDQLAQHSFRLGGKRLRPALLLLSARAVGEVSDAHRVLAAVVEMIHTATLVHDDVLDEAEIRRHEATVNARWNNQTSILLGDYLFSHAFYLASTLDTTFGCRVIGRSTNIVCEGELKQTAASGNFHLSRDDYFTIIDAKTAELCACCCQLGAHYAWASDQVTKSLEAYGRHLGIAFQIADDLLDLEGDERQTGKSLGTDLSNRKMTLPLIHLRDTLDEPQQRELQQLVEQPSGENWERLLDWLAESGALVHARAVADEHAQRAADQLRDVAESPAKTALLQIAQFVTRRDR